MMRYCSLIVAVIVAATSLAAFSCSGNDSDEVNASGDDESPGDSDDSEDDDGDDGAADDDSSDDDTTDDFDPNIEGTSSEPTWYDDSTGFEWETFPSLGAGASWQDMKDYCADLSLGGFDDWRLPSVSEYRSIIHGCSTTQPKGGCNATDECRSYDACYTILCAGCAFAEGITQGCYWPHELSGYCGEYLSATSNPDDASVWFVRYSDAAVSVGAANAGAYSTRCVRGEWFDPNIEGSSTEPTWTDETTGLTWETTPSLVGGHTSQENQDHCGTLELGGYDDWRLASLSEYRSLIRGCNATQTGGACPVTDECAEKNTCYNDTCLGCVRAKGPNHGCYWPGELSGFCGEYLSSTTSVDSGISAWYVRYGDARIDVGGTGEDLFGVRCVRGEWSEK